MKKVIQLQSANAIVFMFLKSDGYIFDGMISGNFYTGFFDNVKI